MKTAPPTTPEASGRLRDSPASPRPDDARARPNGRAQTGFAESADDTAPGDPVPGAIASPRARIRRSPHTPVIRGALFLFHHSIPFLRPVARAIAPRWRAPIVIGLGLIVSAIWAGKTFAPSAHQLTSELYGPSIALGVLPGTGTAGQHGRKDLLHEFIFSTDMVSDLEDGDDVKQLWTHIHRQRAPRLARFACPGQAPASDDRHDPDGQESLYKLSVVIHNYGHRTAENYQLTMTFSGRDEANHDPNVRIHHVETDDLKVSYLYRHAPVTSLPPCLGKPVETGGASPLSRQTYANLGLTRDMSIIQGSLPAHSFQTADYVVEVPCGLEEFAVLFHVQCGNCRLFVKTMSYGQLVRIGGPRACRS